MSEPTTWEQAADRASASLSTCWSDPKIAAAYIAGHDFTRLKAGATRDAYMFLAQSVASLRKARASCWDLGTYRAQIVQLIASKQHDYGHDNINAFGHQGIVVRISDKIARLSNLLARADAPTSSEPIHESIVDTLDDIVGYCVIGVMLLDGTFDLPLAADVAPEPERVVAKVQRTTAALHLSVTCPVGAVYINGARFIPQVVSTANGSTVWADTSEPF